MCIDEAKLKGMGWMGSMGGIVEIENGNEIERFDEWI
jgi:hypothetical protein